MFYYAELNSSGVCVAVVLSEEYIDVTGSTDYVEITEEQYNSRSVIGLTYDFETESWETESETSSCSIDAEQVALGERRLDLFIGDSAGLSVGNSNNMVEAINQSYSIARETNEELAAVSEEVETMAAAIEANTKGIATKASAMTIGMGLCDRLEKVSYSNAGFNSSIQYVEVDGKTYFVGMMYNSSDACRSQIVEFDPETNTFTKLANAPNDESYGFYGCLLFAYDDNLYIVGGSYINQADTNIGKRVLRYNLTNNTYTTMTYLPYEVNSSSGAVFNPQSSGNLMYVMCNNGYIYYALLFDTLTWERTMTSVSFPTSFKEGSWKTSFYKHGKICFTDFSRMSDAYYQYDEYATGLFVQKNMAFNHFEGKLAQIGLESYGLNYYDGCIYKYSYNLENAEMISDISDITGNKTLFTCKGNLYLTDNYYTYKVITDPHSKVLYLKEGQKVVTNGKLIKLNSDNAKDTTVTIESTYLSSDVNQPFREYVAPRTGLYRVEKEEYSNTKDVKVINVY